MDGLGFVSQVKASCDSLIADYVRQGQEAQDAIDMAFAEDDTSDDEEMLHRTGGAIEALRRVKDGLSG